MPFAADLTALLPHAIRFESCVDDSETGTLCDRVYDWFGQRWLAESADWVLAKPVAIVSIQTSNPYKRRNSLFILADPVGQRMTAQAGNLR